MIFPFKIVLDPFFFANSTLECRHFQLLCVCMCTSANSIGKGKKRGEEENIVASFFYIFFYFKYIS